MSLNKKILIALNEAQGEQKKESKKTYQEVLHSLKNDPTYLDGVKQIEAIVSKLNLAGTYNNITSSTGIDPSKVVDFEKFETLLNDGETMSDEEAQVVVQQTFTSDQASQVLQDFFDVSDNRNDFKESVKKAKKEFEKINTGLKKIFDAVIKHGIFITVANLENLLLLDEKQVNTIVKNNQNTEFNLSFIEINSMRKTSKYDSAGKKLLKFLNFTNPDKKYTLPYHKILDIFVAKEPTTGVMMLVMNCVDSKKDKALKKA